MSDTVDFSLPPFMNKDCRPYCKIYQLNIDQTAGGFVQEKDKEVGSAENRTECFLSRIVLSEKGGMKRKEKK